MKLFSILSIWTLCVLPTLASVQEPEEPKISVKIISKAIAPNAMVKATVTMEFGYELHGYANPPMHDGELSVKIDSNLPPAKFKVTYPKGVEIDFLGEKTLVYEGKVEFPITFQAGPKPGLNSVSVKVFYQQCNKSACFPPKTVVVQTAYKVVKPKAKARI